MVWVRPRNVAGWMNRIAPTARSKPAAAAGRRYISRHWRLRQSSPSAQAARHAVRLAPSDSHVKLLHALPDDARNTTEAIAMQAAVIGARAGSSKAAMAKAHGTKIPAGRTQR